MTSLQDLRKLGDSGGLQKEDWIQLNEITNNHQHSFRPCLCTHPIKKGSVFFTKDSIKNYSNPKHAAHSLGPVYNRFKCAASACNLTISPVTLLIRFKEKHESSNIVLGSKRSHSPNENVISESKLSTSKPFLWSDATDGMLVLDSQKTNDSAHITQKPIFNSSAPNEVILQTQALSSQTSSSTDLKLDKLTNLILTLKNESESKMETLLNSFDKLFSSNQNLEKRIQELELRLQKVETQSSRESVTLDNPLQNFSTISNQLFSHSTSIITNPPEPSISKTSWATIAKSTQGNNSSLAKSKAEQNLKIQNRTKLVSNLSKFAKPRTNQTTDTKSIYVGGFDFVKLRVIWNALYEAKFQISRIVSIQWIGRTVLDIVVASDYHLQFVFELTLNKKFRILNFNPSYNAKATSPEANETAMRTFSIRCIKNILNTSNSPLCIKHFKSLSEQYCRDNQELNTIFTQEWAKAKEAISIQTQELVDKISTTYDLLETYSSTPNPSNSETTLNNELQNDLNSLRKLNPNHPILSRATTTQPPITMHQDIEMYNPDTEMDINMISSETAIAASTLEDGNSDN